MRPFLILLCLVLMALPGAPAQAAWSDHSLVDDIADREGASCCWHPIAPILRPPCREIEGG